MKTIIIAHPWINSFNHAIKQTLIDKYVSAGTNFQLIDLYQDKFCPVLNVEELNEFRNGVALDPLVTSYQELLRDTQELVIIFPIWWYSTPAILKGFLDKVMLKDFAYKEIKHGLEGKLNYIYKTTIITTSEAPTWYIKLVKGNFINGVFKKGILRDIGLKNIKWINFSGIKNSSQNKRDKFLKDLNV